MAHGSTCPGGAGGLEPIPANGSTDDGPAGNGGSVHADRTERRGNENATSAEVREHRDGSGRPRAGPPKRSKASLKIACLNIRGFASGDDESRLEKWMRLNQLMRDEKIAILTIQETHLSAERLERVRHIFEPYLDIWNSSDPERETRARGIAFIVNKRIVKDARCECEELIAGRAMILTVKWTADRDLRILGVYGPNVGGDNANFWKDIGEMNTGRVDLLLGDFNVTEDGIDRMPSRHDTEAAVDALSALKLRLRLIDGWRHENPDTKRYTYLQQHSGSQSRIDRIYVRRAMRHDANDWQITESGIATDHKMASVSVTDYQAPFMGKGRWSMPLHLLTDEEIRKGMRRLGSKLIEDLAAIRERSETCNAQLVYTAFKSDLVNMVRERAKRKVPKMKARLDKLRAGLEATLNKQPPEGCDESVWSKDLTNEAAIVQDKIDKLTKVIFERRRDAVAANCRVHGETICKQWIRTVKTPL
ncbi:DNase I-like protein, partial [Trametes sanguinea]